MSRRHTLAAMSAVGALVLGSVAFAATASSAATKGPVARVSGDTTFTCTAGTFPSFEYSATVTVKAYRATADATAVTLVAELTDMPGVVPVSLGKTPITDELMLDLGGEEVALQGSGSTTIQAGEPIAVPDSDGPFTSSAGSVSATVKTFDYAFPSVSMSGRCTPTSGAALGTLTIETGPVPTPSPTDSPTQSPTDSPTQSPTASETPSGQGVPAKGPVAFSCVLNPLNSEFDYDPTITVGGYREEEGGDVILSARMTDIPGISPVPIEGDMTVTLDVAVGGADVTLKGSSKVSEGPKEKVPVPTLSGRVPVEGDELEVVVSEFSFKIVTASLTVDAPCKAPAPGTSLGTMVVGTEPPDVDPTDEPTTDPSDTPGTTTPPSTTGSLPKTGGADALPVVVLWAGALVLLGTAGLLAVPQLSRRRTH